MVRKQVLAERRLAFTKLMTSPSQPSVFEAWQLINQRYPCTFGALAEDWDRRDSWLPTVMNLNDSTAPIEALATFKTLAKQAYGIYVKCLLGGDYVTALNALRTTGLMYAQISRFYSTTVCLRQTVNVVNVSPQRQSNSQAEPDRFRETLMKAVALQRHIELIKGGNALETKQPNSVSKETIRTAGDMEVKL